MNRLKIFLRKTSNISIISICLFIGVTVAVLGSIFNVIHFVSLEEQAWQNRDEYKNLANQLRNGSDYLTDEARKFVVTRDISHLYNYWYEVKVIQSRDNDIKVLQSFNLPQEETDNLNEAKTYSDLLVTTETKAMKLVLQTLKNIRIII